MGYYCVFWIKKNIVRQKNMNQFWAVKEANTSLKSSVFFLTGLTLTYQSTAVLSTRLCKKLPTVTSHLTVNSTVKHDWSEQVTKMDITYILKFVNSLFTLKSLSWRLGYIYFTTTPLQTKNWHEYQMNEIKQHGLLLHIFIICSI